MTKWLFEHTRIVYFQCHDVHLSIIYFKYFRSTLQYTSSDTPFLPVRNNLQGPSLHSSTLHTSSSRNGHGVGTMSGLSGILFEDSKNGILLSHHK